MSLSTKLLPAVVSWTYYCNCMGNVVVATKANWRISSAAAASRAWIGPDDAWSLRPKSATKSQIALRLQ